MGISQLVIFEDDAVVSYPIEGFCHVFTYDPVSKCLTSPSAVWDDLQFLRLLLKSFCDYSFGYLARGWHRADRFVVRGKFRVVVKFFVVLFKMLS